MAAKKKISKKKAKKKSKKKAAKKKTGKKNVIGRPTSYSISVLKKARRYITEYEDVKDMIPSVVGLVKFIGVSRATINRWRNEKGKEDFRDILDEINETQAQVLINKGLSGDFNSNITKLVLGKHGYHDKQDTNIKETTLDLTNLDDDELDAKLKQLESQHEQSTSD